MRSRFAGRDHRRQAVLSGRFAAPICNSGVDSFDAARLSQPGTARLQRLSAVTLEEAYAAVPVRRSASSAGAPELIAMFDGGMWGLATLPGKRLCQT